METKSSVPQRNWENNADQDGRRSGRNDNIRGRESRGNTYAVQGFKGMSAKEAAEAALDLVNPDTNRGGNSASWGDHAHGDPKDWMTGLVDIDLDSLKDID